MLSLPSTGPDQDFQNHVADGQLWLQICDDCSNIIFMPRILCPKCGSLSLTWKPTEGRGTVYSRAVIHRRAKPGQPEPVNHALVLIDLDEGPRMMSHLPNTKPEDIYIGMRVRAQIQGDSGAKMVIFHPEEVQA